MDDKLARDIIEVLPKDRTLFRYHEDRYAIMMLEYVLERHTGIAQIKASRFARLLDRPVVKNIIAAKGDGKLTSSDIAMAWAIDSQSYVLTLGVWGSHKSSQRDWHQTSRTGMNLVLQINFTRFHDVACEKLFGEEAGQFSYNAHPINRAGRSTMSWARIDLDLDRGEALIEEIQNDWLRNASRRLENISRAKAADEKTKAALHDYYHNVLKPHVKQWAEATLAATIHFLVDEIGIRNIWMHDFNTGNRLKKLTRSLPPKSLYTSLPKRFCFEKTTTPPEFLCQAVSRNQRKRFQVGKEQFWQLAL